MFQYQGNNICNKLGITLFADSMYSLEGIVCLGEGEHKTKPAKQNKNNTMSKTENNHNRKQKAESIR